MTQTQTPRTDAIAEPASAFADDDMVISRSRARDLERENATLRAALNTLLNLTLAVAGEGGMLSQVDGYDAVRKARAALAK